jgi:hypothetical protein
MTLMLRLAGLCLAATLLSGCAAVLFGTAGGIAGSEMAEDDGVFDPFERTEAAETVRDALD